MPSKDVVKLHDDIRAEQRDTEGLLVAAKATMDAAIITFDQLNARAKYLRQSAENLALLPEVKDAEVEGAPK